MPFQNNFEFNLGPNDEGFRYTLNFQPVVPVSLSQDYNLIIRTIVPIISQGDVIPNTSQGGLGDIVQSFFFSPKKPVGGLILGFGPVFLSTPTIVRPVFSQVPLNLFCRTKVP